jgi:hypothetical protein
MAALAGGYWDDAWHTERGRDAFLIAPHIAIYAGIATAGAALTLWAMRAVRARGPAAVWSHRPLALALLSVGVTLASGPIDNAWHIAFGRDAVIWSPPHMLGIAGTLGLGAALLAELARRPEPWAAALTVTAGALVIAAAAFTTVEYDTDVPQLDEVFYLPALGFAAAIALLLVRVASRPHWAATAAAALYTVFIVAVGGFLLLVDFPPPALPLLVVPAAVVDVAHRRAWPPLLAAAAYSAALYAAYVPVRNWAGDGVRIDTGDVAVGLPLTWLAVWVVFAVAGGRRPRWAGAGAGAGTTRAMLLPLVALVFVLVPADAHAHDPGQGDDAGTVGWVIALDGRRASATVTLPAAECGATRPRALVARRGGRVVRAPLSRRGCALRGAVGLPARGRWFVYAEMERGGRTVESWLPISVGSGPPRVADARRYAYHPPERSGSAVKAVGGVVLYAGMAALLYATFALMRGGVSTPTAQTAPARRRG